VWQWIIIGLIVLLILFFLTRGRNTDNTSSGNWSGGG